MGSRRVKIVCITMTKRHVAERTFRGLGLSPDRVEFHVAEPSPFGGRYGCFRSHAEVAARALTAAADAPELLVVFEDDVVIAPGTFLVGDTDFVGALEGLVDAIARCEAEWSILRLGWIPPPLLGLPAFFASPTVVALSARRPGCRSAKIRVFRADAVSMHAYVLNRDGMARMARMWSKHAGKASDIGHVDFASRAPEHFGGRALVVAPMMFDQAWCTPSANVPSTAFERGVRASRFLCTWEVLPLWPLVSCLMAAREAVVAGGGLALWLGLVGLGLSLRKTRR